MSQADAPLIALTGATGFLGRHLLRLLAGQGWQVRLLVRSMPLHEQFCGLRPELVPGDLDDEHALARLCRGADAIVHMAGAIKGDAPTLMRINAQGTRHMLDIWGQHAPGARFVCVSSLTAREPHLSAYGASKRAAEDAVMACDGDWLIVRPAAIYGPWDTETLSIFKAARWPVQPMLNGAHARLALIHVQDAARALGVLAQNGPAQQVFELGDAAQNGYGWPEIIAAACRAAGRKERLFRLPAALVKSAATLNARIARARGKVSIFDPGKAREILHPDWTVQSAKRIPKALWTPQVDIDQGFASTVRWYRQRGWL